MSLSRSPGDSQDLRIAAIVVHFGHPEYTERLLRSLQICPLIDRIIVVLHDSIDPQAFRLPSCPGSSQSYPHPQHPSILWIQQENLGYAAGLNRGVRELIASDSSDRLVLALNGDIEIDSETIRELLEQHKAAGADCTFPVLRENSRLIYGYQFSRFGTMQLVRNADWYSGACFLFSLKAWKVSGGLDESYFHYFEDQDFCLRLRKSGCSVHQAERIIVSHQGKSGMDYPASELPRFAVRNHLIALRRRNLLGPFSFINVITRHLLYLFRWKHGWRGIPKWMDGIDEYFQGSVVK
jgi:GT2 family glycosyltransferase